jgi:hypothetical protein
MSAYVERLWILAGMLLLGYALLAAGYQLALWAIRTGRVDVRKLIKELGND